MRKTIRKILFLVASPLENRDVERFGIELLIGNGFEVEVWDLSKILYPYLTNYAPPGGVVDAAYSRVFSNKQSALNAIRRLSSKTILVVFFHYLRERYSFWRAISDSKAEYIRIAANTMPMPSVKIDKEISGKLQKITARKLVNYGFLRLPLRWLRIKTARFVFAGGDEFLTRCHQYPIGENTEIVWAHTLDYDLYLKERDRPSVDRPIAVFLDEYLPFCWDWTSEDIPAPVDAKSYYALLNRFFTLVEKEMGLKVIIAAHPRADYEKFPDCFDGRQWVRGQTIKLVKESQLVLSHFSTSINFANLFYKPVIFMTSLDLERSDRGPKIREMARSFGKEPVCIDGNKQVNWEFELKVSRGHYDNYRRAYIKTDHSEDLPFWQIVTNKVKSLCV